jgi:hypothetical protein
LVATGAPQTYVVLRKFGDYPCNGFTLTAWYSDTYESSPCSGALGTHANQSANATFNAIASMQSDGNFVLYTGSGGSAVWHTHTAGHSNNPIFEIQNDGNMVLYENGTAIWSIF